MIQSKIEEFLSNIKNYEENKSPAKIEENIFKLPITYIEDKHKVVSNLKSDLELLPTEDHISLYNYVFNPITSKSINWQDIEY